jgi:hypothetical protein
MAFFVGKLMATLQGEFQFSQHVCVVAKNITQAVRLLEDCAKNYPDGVTHDGGSWGAQDVKVLSASVQAISKVTFDEMSTMLPVYGNSPKEGNLEEESPAEQARTLAMRLAEHLKRHGQEVSHSRLLHAVSASLGETDWHVLLSKDAKSGKPAESDKLVTLLSLAATALRDLHMGYASDDIVGYDGLPGLGGLLCEMVDTLRAMGIDDEGAWNCDLTEELDAPASSSKFPEVVPHWVITGAVDKEVNGDGVPVTLRDVPEGAVISIVELVERQLEVREQMATFQAIQSRVKRTAKLLGYELTDVQVSAIASRVDPMA